MSSTKAKDSFGARSTLEVGDRSFEIFRLDSLQDSHKIELLPFSIKILLENLLRHEDGSAVVAEDVEAVASWASQTGSGQEIAFTPSRVLLQDFTGVPAVVDLAAMRDAVKRLDGDPKKINPLRPVELVIDHSVQVDVYGTRSAFQRNAEIEFERNRERYGFLRWGQQAFENFGVVPPDTGIVHQVNLEYLAQVVAVTGDGVLQAIPDTLVGTDSHTTMVNALGVLGWGVGGIEAEAAMLGQPVTMLLPEVVGFELRGGLAEGATATDLVLMITEMLRQKGVVGKFVEFFGEGIGRLSLADRATISNMSPEFGATCAIFPIDRETVHYLELTGRSPEQVALVEAYAKEQSLFHDESTPEARYTDKLVLDLADVVPSVAGPRRPQDRIPLGELKQSFGDALEDMAGPGTAGAAERQVNRFAGEGGHTAVGVEESEHSSAVKVCINDIEHEINHGSVVIAAITSCTNTSNPAVMIGAGLVAKKARELGMYTRPWVKTSLAPGSKVVSDYLEASGLTGYLDELNFNLVGYGCTTCIGNSGPLPPAISAAIEEGDLVVASALSGNRNFEGRINSEVKANYLASPPLVVAFALAGRIDIDLAEEPLGIDGDGNAVYLKDVWPSTGEIAQIMESAVKSEMFRKSYSDVFSGDERWSSLEAPKGDLFKWDDASTYIKSPPFFEGMSLEPEPITDVRGARVLALLGDSVTTDHISPAGAIEKDSPAGLYLIDQGVEPRDFNSYGSRRGNHEVMMRGTFANVRLRNKLVPEVEGGVTVHLPDREQMAIYDAAMMYREEGTPLVVLAGKEYGSGSSRDWAAKGTKLLGVRAVIAESYERIHRSNLIGMGVLPLQFKDGESVETLGLTGGELFDLSGYDGGQVEVTVSATPDEDGEPISFKVLVRIDTPQEVEYFRHGGILQFVLRRLLKT